MKYTVIAANFTTRSLSDTERRISDILTPYKAHWVAPTLGIYLFKTKECAQAIHHLLGLLMQAAIPFVSIQTEGPLSVGLSEDQYSELEKFGIEIHKLVLGK